MKKTKKKAYNKPKNNKFDQESVKQEEIDEM